MKIGIITFWESENNYGQILQLYAMQSILKKIGHDPFLIKYHQNSNRTLAQRFIKMNLLASIKYRLTAEYGLAKISRKKDKKRNFKAFKKQHIWFGNADYYNLEEFRQNPPIADAYLTGSDQVWNHKLKGSTEAFLLGFGKSDIRRISYAASYGVRYQDITTQAIFKKYLKNFSAISVREQSGVELTRQLGYAAEWVLDPTMLLTKDEWIDLLPFRNTIKDPEIKKEQLFIYTLGNSEIQDKEKFINYAKNLDGVDVIHTSANNDFLGDAYLTIPEWLYYIRTSKFVITDSFHGMIFCILNNTNFVVLPNTGHAAGMNERIDSMLEVLELKDHIMTCFDINKIENILSRKINWIKLNKKIYSWREDSISFLKRSLKL